MNNQICAGVVLFNPDIERLKKNVASLLEQVKLLYLYDNASTNIELLKETFSNDKIKFILSNQNLGIAAGLNSIMRHAEMDQFQWVLAMDQDTILCPDVVNLYQPYLDDESIGMLSPNMIKREVNQNQPLFSKKVSSERIEKCFTSGSLLRTSDWKRVGGYDDWFFIDYVDYDMCLKLKKINKKIIRVNNAVMVQDLGNVYQVKWLNWLGEKLHSKKIVNLAHTYNHSPFRNYYFVRNGLVYLYEYQDYLDVSYERKRLINWEIKKLILEPKKVAQIKAIRKGIKDSRIEIKKRSL